MVKKRSAPLRNKCSYRNGVFGSYQFVLPTQVWHHGQVCWTVECLHFIVYFQNGKTLNWEFVCAIYHIVQFAFLHTLLQFFAAIVFYMIVCVSNKVSCI